MRLEFKNCSYLLIHILICAQDAKTKTNLSLFTAILMTTFLQML